MNNHTDFILSPISNILKDVVVASSGVGDGIETYPLYEYVMQSVLLKMTGFQEQKMKCICWELATNDYEYRYKRYVQKTLGECSCYNEKNTVYEDLIEQIKKYECDFAVINDIDRENIRVTTLSEVKNMFLNTNISIWSQRDFNEYEEVMNYVESICFSDVQLFANCPNCPKNGRNKRVEKCLNNKNLNEIHDILYNQRNRLAHNVQSYQQAFPKLKIFLGKDYKYRNYFIYFYTLILIDKIFIELYRKYLNVIDNGF